MPDLMPTEIARAGQPATLAQAMLRGALGRCPDCGQARLFARFLKPHAACPACGRDWTPQRADDFPPYASLFITGHLVAPLALHLARDPAVSPGMAAAIVLPVTATLAVALLQPAKGAIIALQWRMGLHGFADAAGPG